jgi:hypothetical protein
MNALVHRSHDRYITHNDTTLTVPMPPCAAAHRGAHSAPGAKPPPASRVPSPTTLRHRSFGDCRHPTPQGILSLEQSRFVEPLSATLSPTTPKVQKPHRPTSDRQPVRAVAQQDDRNNRHRKLKTPPRTTLQPLASSTVVMTAPTQSHTAERDLFSRHRTRTSPKPTPSFSLVNVLHLANAPAKLRRANAIVIPAWASRAPSASAGC